MKMKLVDISEIVPDDSVCEVEFKEIDTINFEKRAESLKMIEAKRMEWESNAYRTSNQQLYSVLADCYYYAYMKLDKKLAKQREWEIAQLLKIRNYIVKRDSPLITRVVKAVFGNIDRRRISTYSLVLRAAKIANVSADDIPAWIEAQGGIQEIRVKKSVTHISTDEKV